jgi:hypothetical protein
LFYRQIQASAQPRGFPARGAHHLEEIDSIWRKEKAFWKRSTWVFFVGSLASFLVYSGGDYPYSLFLELGTNWRREGRIAERGYHVYWLRSS